MLEARFLAALDFLGPFLPSPHLAIALSGGADSLAITLLAHEWATKRGGRITALTVDHRLRTESTAEAEHVAAMMRARGITHHILTPEHTANSNNLQEAARNWRYHALGDYCRSNGLLHCLVAHHAGDNRETVQHNLERGDTADGASGMRTSRNIHGVRFLRPLLTCERVDLEAYLRANKLTWIDDPSNQNTSFARVRTRQMLQQNTVRVAELDGVIAQQSAARIVRDHALAKAAMQCVTMSPLGFADIDLDAWRALEPLLASQLLADCLTTISGQTNRPRASDSARLIEAMQQPAFVKRTLQHCEITLRDGIVRIARELSRVGASLLLEGAGEVIWDERFRVRYAIPEGVAYQLRALDRHGYKLLREQGFDLPLATPALWHLDELEYVPHIGMPHPASQQVRIGFAPAKPLAAAPFW